MQSFWLNGSFEMLRGAVIAGAETPEEPSIPESAPLKMDTWTSNPLEPLLRITDLCSSARVAAEGQQVDEAAGKASGARAEEARAKKKIVGDASETALL